MNHHKIKVIMQQIVYKNPGWLDRGDDEHAAQAQMVLLYVWGRH